MSEPVYEINKETCVLCKICDLYCNKGAIIVAQVDVGGVTDVKSVWIDKDNCDNCGECVPYCPVGAIYDINSVGTPPGGGDPIGNPKLYTPGPNDSLADTNMSKTMTTQIQGLCVVSIMGYLGDNLCDGEVTQDAAVFYYMQLSGNVDITQGVELQYMDDLVNHYFYTHNFGSFTNAIDQGYVVMTDMATSQSNVFHNVVIVGYKYNGYLIYMDPEVGKWMEAHPDYFNNNYNFVISGCK